MKRNNQELDAILDNAVAGIRDEQLDATQVASSTSRVWARVSDEAAAAGTMLAASAEPAVAAAAAAPDHIRNCADFQSIIPTYLQGKLSPARAMLLEDHTHECIPCRRALKAERSGEQVAATRAVRRPVRAGNWSAGPAWRWSIAAGVAICAVLAGAAVYKMFPFGGGTALAATIESTNGAVYRVTDTEGRALAVGEQIKAGERVRTAKDSAAVLKLADGSTVEMRERSEFSVGHSGKDTTVKLERGDVIVEAAKRTSGHLYVQTPDSLVSVTGTIFSVGSGTKGSRVSVVEGEVHVAHSGQKNILRPGDQTTSSVSLERVPVTQDVAWSRNAQKYNNLVTELTKLRQDLNQRVARPGVRYSSRFLDLVPENTVLYAALPNLAESLAESHRIMQERIKQNPALAEWVGGGMKREGRGAGFDDSVIERVREFGAQLGEEIVVSAGMDAKGEPSSVVVFGELKDAANFRPFVEKQIAQMGGAAGGGKNPVRFVDDPLTANVGAGDAAATAATPAKAAGAKAKASAPRREELYVWVRNDLFVASPKLEALRAVETTMNDAAASRFVGTPFHTRLSEVYKEGAGLVVAADLEKIVGQFVAKESSDPNAARHVEAFRRLGLLSLKHFVVEQKELRAKTQSRAVVSFGEPRRGIASWLAEPGPMGALEFISPNANVAAAFVVKEPSLLVDDLLGFLETAEPNLRKQLRELETQQGFDIRRDFAAPLGGEFAFAIDGPLLPTPSWKMVIEVYDQPKLQLTMERVVERLNAWAAQHGSRGLRWENTTDGAQTFYSLRSADLDLLQVHYTYANGYLIAGPSKALLLGTLKSREAQLTLLNSARFKSALPEDGNANFSAIFYHDLAPLLQPLAERAAGMAGSLSEEQRKALGTYAADTQPTLAYVYAQGERITLAANTEGGPFGLSPSSLMGMPNSFAIQHILMDGMGGKKSNSSPKELPEGAKAKIDEAVRAAEEGARAAEKNATEKSAPKR